MSSTWSKSWGKFSPPTGFIQLASRAIHDGDLLTAIAHARQNRFERFESGQRLLDRLIDALILRTREQMASHQFENAWSTISGASEVALPEHDDKISKEKTELVEMTIDFAESLLVSAQISHALKVIRELESRNIQDWRADRIRISAEKVRDAESRAAEGNCRAAIELLEEARETRPDLSYVDSRIATCGKRKEQITTLTNRLQDALLIGDLVAASRNCRQLLVIAPHYEVAQNAQRRLMDIRKKKTNNDAQKTNHNKSESAEKESTPATRSPLRATSNSSEGPVESENPSIQATEKSFMLWIDGVGGYLVCPATQNTIGQAVPQSNVQIPILGDLQRRHCQIESFEQDHLLQPFGNVKIDGEETKAPTPLKSHQLIEFEGGVNLRYEKPHPLSGSARLEFQSRHRTHPWSDSVLLASGPLILGPGKQSHVSCSRWGKDLVIFQRDGKWFARTAGALEIDGQQYDGEGPLNLDSRIVSEDLTLSLEPVSD